MSPTAYDTYRSVFFNGNVGVGTSPYDDPRFRLHLYNALQMVVQSFKTGGDVNDINIDTAINVKHSKAYADTPGYAHTYQVYASAGMNGLILGSNNFVGLDRNAPYAPTPAVVPDGFVALELGPLWPYSEKARLNNRGDLIVGWALVRKYAAASQTDDVVTTTADCFEAADVGQFVCWGDYENKGIDRHADRITEILSATQARVETSRRVFTQAGRVCSPRVVVTASGCVEIRNSEPPAQRRNDAGVLFVQDGALMFRGAAGTVTTVAPA